MGYERQREKSSSFRKRTEINGLRDIQAGKSSVHLRRWGSWRVREKGEPAGQGGEEEEGQGEQSAGSGVGMAHTLGLSHKWASC